MLLLTFMRNTEQIIQFKTKLVLEFYRMKQQIILLQKENAIQYREAGIRLNDYDDNFKTISRLIKENNLEKEFTPKVLNDLLVNENLAEKKKISVSITKFKHTKYTRHAPPNKNTKKASNLIHKDYFLNVLIPLAREKGIKRTTKFIPKMRGEFIFSLLAFLSFFFVLMTYFGVNFYIAQGLHAYGRGQGDAAWFTVLKDGIGVWFAVVIATLIMSITHKKR
jgi:hypothetical protein